MKNISILILSFVLFISITPVKSQSLLSGDLVGNWEVLVEATQMGDVTLNLSLFKEDGELKGYVTSPIVTEQSKLSKAEIENNTLTVVWSSRGGNLELVLEKTEKQVLVGKLADTYVATAKKTANEITDFSVSTPKLMNVKTDVWNANWISFPEENKTEYGIYLFRKQIELSENPEEFLVHVSADNRYKLYVNEKLVSLGPARGDVTHWNYETIDLAPYLIKGKNTIAAKVWNMGAFRPEAQITLQTAFILQGGSQESQILNTNNTWKCTKDESYAPIVVKMATFYVAGPGEQINMNSHIVDWEKEDFNDSSWKEASFVAQGMPKTKVGYHGVASNWLLVPSGIPQMELSYQRLEKVRRAEGIKLPTDFPKKKTAVTIPKNSKVSILLDQTFLTNAYPSLIFSGGKGGEISLSYQESLFSEYPNKGNRNEIDDKTLIGRKDIILPNGNLNQSFTSLSWRTYRYIQLEINTKDDSLVLEDIYGTFTGYPFELNSKLNTDDAFLEDVLEIGWRTARLCAEETYMDCPYYEKLQYIGDGRIQAMVSLYNSGDDRLLKNALNQMNNSIQPEGVTMSRHPSSTPQFIPTFSFWYIGMLHDYLMYGNDSGFVKDKLTSTRQILQYFKGYQQEDGSLKDVPYWMFTDWVTTKGWSEGIAPIGKDNTSAVIDLQLLWAYQVAASLEKELGYNEIAEDYLKRAAQLKTTIQDKYWDDDKQLFADNAEKELFSQHANILAILTDVVSENEVQEVADKILTDNSLAPASIYFKYYLHQALTKAGLGNDYLSWLGKWQENIDQGLTTWAETSDVNATRSDSHAWGSSPNIEFFRIILGIDSDAPGFSKIKIEPHLGDIKEIWGEIPHPNGKISVGYKFKRGKLEASIQLPRNTSGTFIWKGKTYELKTGSNDLRI